jgi:glyoxylase-like metal-dependent hydrolase (beta-lactamase superfamily II)
MRMIKATSFPEVTRFDLSRRILGRGRYWTTAYLVDGVMIDTGCAHTAGELISALTEEPLLRVINTHTHEDHIGGNRQLQQEREGLPILAHPLALQVLADPRREQPLHPYRKVMWGWPGPSRATAVSDGEVVETRRHALQVIYTPGHSRDHICLYEARQGWLFTGDLFVGGYDRALRVDCSIWQIIESLKRIETLGASTLFPGAARVRDNPGEAIRDKIDYLERLGEQVLELDRQGKSVGEIVRRLCGSPMLIELLTLGHFTRAHLVRSFLHQPKG